MKRLFSSFLRVSLLLFLLAGIVFQPQSTVYAAGFTIEPITWNIMGLDSNDPSTGPNHFPVGVRVCNDTGADANNVTGTFVWDTGGTATASEVYSRSGTDTTLSVDTLAAGTCTDFYYEVEISRTLAPYDKTRRFHIEVTSDETGATKYYSDMPREVYVEHLVSQNRNAVTNVYLDDVSIAAGGTMSLIVGQTYTIKLEGYTAIQGYEQIEYFINFPNTIFQILSVSSTFTADTSAYESSPMSKLYGDNCKWESDPTNPNYRSCLDVGKTGGTVTTTYQVKILQVPGAPLVNPEPLSTLIYDFSGSSFHYNADYDVSTRFAYILDPSAIDISKGFLPDSVIPGNVSTLTIRIPNPTTSELSGVNFVDDLPDTTQIPAAPGDMVVANPPNLSYTGCNASSTPAPASLTAGAGTISFSNISIPAGATCVLKFDVSVPVIGIYTNQTGNLLIDALDTGNFATADLNVSNTVIPCTNGSMARWTVPTTATNPPDAAGGVPTTKAGNVTTATLLANVSAGGTVVRTTNGAPAPNTDTGSWSTWGYKTGGYIEFALQTKNYSQISLNLWMYDASPSNGPDTLVISYSTDGTNFTPLTTYSQSAPPTPNPFQSAWTNHTFDFTGLTSTTNNTYFRITGSGAKNDNSGASMDYDYMTFTGCSYYPPPTISKTFATDPIKVFSTTSDLSLLTFTVSNTVTTPYNAVDLTDVYFDDTLPGGLKIYNGVGYTPSTTCTSSTGAALALTAVDDTDYIHLTGADMAAGTSCTVSVYVKGTTAGQYQNVSGYVGSTESGTSKNYATDTITVVAPPVLSKSFSPTVIMLNDTSVMQFTITNPNTTTTLTNIDFTDSGAGWPAGLTATNSTTNNVCGAGSSLVVSGGNSVVLTNGTLAPSASCTFSVDVTGTTIGTKTNTTSAVTASTGVLSLTGNTASATLTVNNPVPLIGLNKQVSTDNTNWYKYVGVIPTQDIWYKFTVTNDGETALNNIDVTDDQFSSELAAECTAATKPFASPFSLAVGASASCVIGPISITSAPTPNPFVNTATVTTTTYTPSTLVTSTAKYGTKSLTIVKNVTESYFTAAGNTLHYSYSVTNDGGYPLLGPVTVTDDKVGTVSCQDPIVVGDNDAYLDPGETVACPATGTITYTVLANPDVDPNKQVTNTAYGSADGVDSPSVNKTVPLAALTIDKNTTTSSVDINGNVVYTIVVVNTGVAALTNFQVTDTLPFSSGEYTTPVSVTATVTSGSITPSTTYNGSGNLLAGTDILAAGATATITITVDLVNATPGTYDNTATAITTETGSIDDDGTVGGDPGTPGIDDDPETDEDVTLYAFPILTLQKTVVNDNGGTAVDTAWTLSATQGATAISGAEGDAAITNAVVTAGTWDLRESGGPAGYTEGVWVCSGSADTDPTNGLTLSYGEDVTCTITNDDDPPSLTLLKTVTNDDGGTAVATAWTLTATGTLGAPTNLSGTTPVTSGAGFKADTYSLGENGPSGYSASLYSCVKNASAPVFGNTITIVLGDTVTCTINNNDNLVGAPSLTIVKDADKAAVSTAGETITYTITVDNTGNIDLTNVVLDDVFAGGATLTSGDDGDNVLETNETWVYTADYVVTQADLNAGTALVNVAGVDTDQTTRQTDDATTTVTQSPSLTIVKDADKAAVSTAGETITYTITVDNTGNIDLTNVVLDDVFAGGATLTSGDDGDNVLETNETWVYTADYVVTQADLNAGTALVNVAGVDTDQTTRQTDDATTTVTQSPSLTIVKNVTGTGPYVLGSTIDYQVLVTNTGDLDLTNVDVTDTKLTNMDCDGTAGVPYTTQDLSIAVGGSLTCVGSYTVVAGDLTTGSVTNVAGVTTNEVCTTAGACTDTEITKVNNPALTLNKTATLNDGVVLPSGEVNAGDTITYAFEVANTGNVILTNVTVSDSLLSDLSCTPIANLAIGATQSFTCTNNVYTLTQTDIDNGSVMNTADVNANEVCTGANDCTDTETTPFVLVIDPAISKVGDPLQASIGETVTFTLDVTNQGNTSANGVVITDDLPSIFDVTAVNVSGAPFGTSVNVTPPIGTGSAPYSVVVTLGGPLQPNGLVTIEIVTRVNGLGNPPITNTARVTAQGDVNLSNNADGVTIRINAPSGIGLPNTGFAPNVVTELPEQPRESMYASTDLLLEIPSLGVKIPIVGVPAAKRGWDVSWLGRQAGWLEGSAFPTWSGNSVLTSHVYDANGLPGPFVNLNKLKYGDRIIVHINSQKYIYEVRTNQVVTPNDASSFKHEEKSWLTLITCKEYDQKTNTYKKRVVVRAVLVKVEGK